jgi:hypothetical protein
MLKNYVIKTPVVHSGKKREQKKDRFKWYLEKEGITCFLFDCLLDPLNTLKGFLF